MVGGHNSSAGTRHGGSVAAGRGRRAPYVQRPTTSPDPSQPPSLPLSCSHIPIPSRPFSRARSVDFTTGGCVLIIQHHTRATIHLSHPLMFNLAGDAKQHSTHVLQRASSTSRSAAAHRCTRRRSSSSSTHQIATYSQIGTEPLIS
jgi:hypothetical protein